MNALHIITDYLYLKNNPNAPFTPKTYIFGAKAAPGYLFAKEIIQMIYKISKEIEKDKNNYEVDLSNNVELTFNKKFQLIDVD